jgi:heterodisulfide reductase subunit A-like polyferredoxin
MPDSFVVPDAARCVQCGVCGYNCPVGIPVRDYAHRGRIVDDPACVQCGQCIEACPRGTLRWGHLDSPQIWPHVPLHSVRAGGSGTSPNGFHDAAPSGASR